MIDEVWEKGKIIDRISSSLIRTDKDGAPIAKILYNVDIEHGWIIAHIKPMSEGGTDEIGNLEPRHWQKQQMKCKKI